MANENLELTRTKTGMIIYAIEVGVGNFIRNNSNDEISNIEALNFGELFQRFSQVKLDTQTNECTKNLKKLADDLEIFMIRNCCAHPVRDFQFNYWYKAAAFASDPKWQSIGINGPSEALACAEANQISNPPQSWLDNLLVLEIPNNLPIREQFDITGLVGRNKEIDLLINDILNGRNNIIALVAPGGVGKTSLIIEVARRLSDRAVSKNKFSKILFVSIKIESLTAEGRVKINKNINQIDIESQFNIELSSLTGVENLSSEKLNELATSENILVILDNLEDLINEDLELYQKFIEKIPHNWKIVLTSRIPVDGAKNIEIKYLSPAAIEDLARRYYSQTLGKDIESHLLSKLVESSFGNPLALKLVIDRLVLGYPLTEATSKVADEVLQFSFDQLIGSLNESHQKILECIFVFNSCTKSQLLEYTLLHNDLFQESISKLFKTSLIERIDENGVDSFQISPHLKSLLSKNPLNLTFRQQFQKKFTDFKIVRKIASKNKIINVNSFRDDAPTNLEKISSKIINLWTKNRKDRSFSFSSEELRQLREFTSLIDSHETAYKSFPDFYRIRAITKILLSDMKAALNDAKLSYELDKDWIVNARFFADTLIQGQENHQAVEVLKPFVEKFVAHFNSFNIIESNYEIDLIRDIFSSFFKANIFQENFDEVIQYTNNWKTCPASIQGTFAHSRACAIRRISEPFSFYNEKKEALSEVLALLKFCKIELGYFGYPVKTEILKMQEEFIWLLQFPENQPFLEELKSLVSLSSVLAGGAFPIDKVERAILISHEKNLKNIVPDDAIEAVVTRTFPTYAFAANSDKSYFIRYKNIQNKNKILQEGQTVKVWGIHESNNRNQAFNVDFCKY